MSTLDRLSGFSESDTGKGVAETLSDHDDLAKGLAEPTLLSKDGVLHLKPAFFDPALVAAIEECKGSGAASFGSCVRARFASEELTNDKEKSWLNGTKFIPWSGVRERPFTVTKDLEFLKPPNGNDPANRLWPFDFLVQISFTTPAVNAPTANDRYTDQDPLEFKSLRPKLQELVDQGIRTQGLSPSLQDLRDFAVLQRLFRLGLRGTLGDQFPVSRLALLERQTAGDIPYIHTARWQRSNLVQDEQSLMGFAAKLQFTGDSTQAWVSAMMHEARACVVSLDMATRNRAVNRLAGCDMRGSKRLASVACVQSSGKNRDACRWADSYVSETSLESELKVERAFGVLDDQKKKES